MTNTSIEPRRHKELYECSEIRISVILEVHKITKILLMIINYKNRSDLKNHTNVEIKISAIHNY